MVLILIIIAMYVPRFARNDNFHNIGTTFIYSFNPVSDLCARVLDLKQYLKLYTH